MSNLSVDISRVNSLNSGVLTPGAASGIGLPGTVPCRYVLFGGDAGNVGPVVVGDGAVAGGAGATGVQLVPGQTVIIYGDNMAKFTVYNPGGAGNKIRYDVFG